MEPTDEGRGMTADQARWSVSLVADGDREVTLEEVVELADAVAASGGIASGIGTTSYGAQLLVTATSPKAAAERAAEAFQQAVAQAGLPAWPITLVDLVSETEELEEYEEHEEQGEAFGEVINSRRSPTADVQPPRVGVDQVDPVDGA